MDMVKIELWVLVDEEGNWVVDADESNLGDRYDEEIESAPMAMRKIKVTLSVPKPQQVELEGVVGPEPAAGELKVA